jgi:hypothetical protein
MTNRLYAYDAIAFSVITAIRRFPLRRRRSRRSILLPSLRALW